MGGAKPEMSSSEAQRGTAAPPPTFRPPTSDLGHPEPRASADGSSAAVTGLLAEVETLKAELAAARAKVRELESRANVDPLLDILNRRGFERELRRSLAYVKRYGTAAALIYLDLDGFKRINDTHGHAAGDALLRAVGAALVRSVRASDVVGRLGGDELAILLWNADAALATAKAAALERLIGAVEVCWPTGLLTVGASAGCATLGHCDRPADVLERSDRAMYARKAVRRHLAMPASRIARS